MSRELYRIAGVTVAFDCADRRLRRLITEAWSAFRLDLSRPRRPSVDALFRFPDRAPGALPRLKRWHRLVTDRFVMLSDGHRYLLAGHRHGRPWHFEIRSLPGWDPEFVYYYVCEPLLLDVLKQHRVLVWHSAAVERGGRAILLPAASGSGKSTTVMNLIGDGCRFVADDVAVLRCGRRHVTVTGFETGLYLTDRSVNLLPDWRRRVSGRYLMKGRRRKRRIDLSSFLAPRSRPATVASILFPAIGSDRLTRLERLSEAEALVACLDQQPKEYPGSTLGRAAADAQFEIYGCLARSAKSYRITLGRDQEHVRETLKRVSRDL